VLTPKSLQEKSQLLEADFIVTNNIKFFSDEQLEWMLGCKRVRYEHDYWNLIRPSQEPFIKKMWEGSLVGIFLSQSHYYEYRRLHPNVEFRNILIQPSPIDAFDFEPKEKKNICVYLGALVPHKGTIEALTWAKSKGIRLYVYGKIGNHLYGIDVKEHPNCIYEGMLDYEGVREVLGEADMFIHIPQWVEPYGRSAIEARLSGCRVITNNRLGAKSYAWWDEDFTSKEMREYFSSLGRLFWERLEKAI